MDGLIWASFPEQPGVNWGTLTEQVASNIKTWQVKAKRAKANAKKRKA